MKRSSFRRRSALFSSRTRLTVAAVVALALLAAVLRFAAPGAFFAAAAPVFSLGASASGGVGSFFDSFSDAAEQAAHIDALQAEVRALANENAALVARLADIGAPADDEAESIRAGVIARPPLAPYDMLIIGAGAMDGVELGALVTAEGGVPVGSVSSVAAHTAQVSLFSSPGRSTEGWAGETRIPLTLFGKGSGAFAAEVPRDAGIIIGDQVFVPGPGALPVGRVKEVETGPSSPSATIRIEPLANVFSITFVAVRPAP